MDNLPPQVARQLKEAEDYMASLTAQPVDDNLDQQTENEQVDESGAQPEATQLHVETTQAAEPQGDEPPREETVRYWRDRFQTFQGYANAELQRANVRAKQLEQQFADATARLERLEKEREQAQAAAQQAPLVTDKDRENYGPEMLDLMNRVAQQAIASVAPRFEQELAARDQRIAELTAQLGGVAQRNEMTVQQQFAAAVRTALPWYTNAEDTDQDFSDWLDEQDSISGFTRRTLLEDAKKNLDARRVVAIINAFWGPKRAAKDAPQAPTAAQTQQQAELRRQVAPPKASTASSTPATDRVWTEADYRAAHDPRNYSTLGYEKALERMQEADRALAEGRVRFSSSGGDMKF